MKTHPDHTSRFSPVDIGFLALASCFFVSYLPAHLIGLIRKPFGGRTLARRRWTGAGFFGSLAGAATFFFLPASIANGWWAVLLAIALSIFVSHYAEMILDSHDDSRIVIDEWAGVWVALWGLNQTIGIPFILAFTLFRVFDVFKGPWGNALQKLPGGWGVTMDDVAAGLIANVGTRLFMAFII